MKLRFTYSLMAAFGLLISMSDAQELVVEVADVDVEVEVEPAEALADAAQADVVVEAVVEEEGIVGQAVEGFFNLIGGGFGGGRRVQPAKEAYTKDVDKIETEAELDKLEKELAQDANLQGMMPHYKTQFKSQCNAELRLLHLVCKLTRSEFQNIEKDVRLASQRCLLSVCQQQAQMMQGIPVKANAKKDTPNQRMEKVLLLTAERELDADRLRKYKAELDERREFQKQGIIGMLVNSVDSLVILSEGQRPKVEKIFEENWNTQWLSSAQYLMNSGIQYVPKIPKTELRELLSDEQKTVFTSVRWQPQNGVQYFNGFNMFGFGQNQQNDLEDELEFALEAEDLAEDKTK